MAGSDGVADVSEKPFEKMNRSFCLGELPIHLAAAAGAPVVVGIEVKQRVLMVWDTETKREICSIPCAGLVGFIKDVALSPDGRLAAIVGTLSGSGSDKNDPRGSILLIETKPDGRHKSLRAHQGVVNCATFSSDGHYLATGGTDGRILIWPLEKVFGE